MRSHSVPLPILVLLAIVSGLGSLSCALPPVATTSAEAEQAEAEASDSPALAAVAAPSPPHKPPAPPQPAIDFGRYFALVVGNDRYESLPRLATAARDARAVASAAHGSLRLRGLPRRECDAGGRARGAPRHAPPPAAQRQPAHLLHGARSHRRRDRRGLLAPGRRHRRQRRGLDRQRDHLALLPRHPCQTHPRGVRQRLLRPAPAGSACPGSPRRGAARAAGATCPGRGELRRSGSGGGPCRRASLLLRQCLPRGARAKRRRARHLDALRAHANATPSRRRLLRLDSRTSAAPDTKAATSSSCRCAERPGGSGSGQP